MEERSPETPNTRRRVSGFCISAERRELLRYVQDPSDDMPWYPIVPNKRDPKPSPIGDGFGSLFGFGCIAVMCLVMRRNCLTTFLPQETAKWQNRLSCRDA